MEHVFIIKIFLKSRDILFLNNITESLNLLNFKNIGSSEIYE
jgi:hypothetical protein